jgi:molecular chaperone GrpE
MADEKKQPDASKDASKGAKDTKAQDTQPLTPDEKTKQPGDKVKQIEELVKQKDKKIADLEADLKWARSDFENFRKSNERRMDVEKEALQGKLMRDLLPFFDTFDKAMQTAKDIADQDGGMSDSLKKFFGGLDGLYKNLNDILESRKLKRMNALGKKFDYNYHEVMMQVEDPNLPEDMIVQEIQQGWLLNGKVLRPAMVAVSKKPAVKETEKPDAACDPADAAPPAANDEPDEEPDAGAGDAHTEFED